MTRTHFQLGVVGALLLVAAVAVQANSEDVGEQQVVGAVLQAAQAQAEASQPAQQEESYQKVYEAFTKLMQNVGNNSLGNARRLVSRLNQLVGGQQAEVTAPTAAAAKPVVPRPVMKEQPQSVDEKTEQILTRLDNVNKDTDQHTLRQLNDDVNRLVTTLSDSYLRNIRRVIERVNKTIGTSSSSSGALHQSGDRLTEDGQPKGPGFPGWDEFIVAVDRMQKSLANFVRSSTRLITSG